VNAAVLYYMKGLLWSLGGAAAFWAAFHFGLATRAGRAVFMLAYFATHKTPMVPHVGGGPYYLHLWFWLTMAIVFSTTFLLYLWRSA
jgi:hypothetical protein